MNSSSCTTRSDAGDRRNDRRLRRLPRVQHQRHMTISAVSRCSERHCHSANGHFLIADNPDGATGPTLVYSLNGLRLRRPGVWTATPAGRRSGGQRRTCTFNTATPRTSAHRRGSTPPVSSIVAGLFKEGNGIPAVTAATQPDDVLPRSVRDPQDTGARDRLSSRIPSLARRSAPRRNRAAGPENLDGPVHLTNSTWPRRSRSGAAKARRRICCATRPSCRTARSHARLLRTLTNNTGSI